VSQLEFADELLARIGPKAGRFHPRAFLFVLAALEHRQQRLTERRHVSGGELAHACRELALEQYGLLARTVLAHWGIATTADFGAIVYALIDAGLLIRQPEDRLEDFEDVYAFPTAFEEEYVWGRGVVREGEDVIRGGDDVMK
jgi:uncharacterized repeat protein (TIGR04138 family)